MNENFSLTKRINIDFGIFKIKIVLQFFGNADISNE